MSHLPYSLTISLLNKTLSTSSSAEMSAPASFNVRLSPDAKRLYWSLAGSLADSLWVMETSSNITAREPYVHVQPSNTTDATASLHQIAQSPFTEPKVPSVTVRIAELEDWENDWLNLHSEHWDPPDRAEEHRDESGEVTLAFGPLPDASENDDDEEGGDVNLLKCCGTIRPRGKAVSLMVTPKAESGRDFVAIDDYVLAVHPWLMGLIDDILGAKAFANDEEPLSAGIKLMVGWFEPCVITVSDEDEWIRDKTSVLWAAGQPPDAEGANSDSEIPFNHLDLQGQRSPGAWQTYMREEDERCERERIERSRAT